MYGQFYGFRTGREEIAVGALLVYAVYMSRDRGRFKVSKDMWGQIESACRHAARKAFREIHMQADPQAGLSAFVERLKPRLSCRTVQPRFQVAKNSTSTSAILESGEIVELEEKGKREFWNDILEETEAEPVLRAIRKETGLVVGCVRERIEREKTLIERGFIRAGEEEDA